MALVTKRVALKAGAAKTNLATYNLPESVS